VGEKMKGSDSAPFYNRVRSAQMECCLALSRPNRFPIPPRLFPRGFYRADLNLTPHVVPFAFFRMIVVITLCKFTWRAGLI
jgi:hypothetical protein